MGFTRIDYGRMQVIPIFIGIFIGFLAVMDFYIGHILASYFGLAGFIKVIPLGAFMIIFFLAIALCILIININKAIEKREIVFIILLIIGLQSIGIFPGRIDSSDLFFALFISFWLLTVFATKRYVIIGSPLNFLNLALLFFAILSAINGGLSIVNPMAPLLKAMVTSFLIVEIVRRKELVVFFIKTLFVITAFSALIGILQEILFLHNGTILAQYNAKYLNLMLEPTPFGTFLRVPAFTSMHLYLANYLGFCLLIGLNYFLYFSNIMERREKLLLLMTMGVMVSALILTFSKTNIFALCVGILVSLFVKWRHQLIQAISLILLAVMIAYLGGLWGAAYNFIVSQKQLLGDIALRLELMRSGIEGFFYKHPYIGTGLGQGKAYSQDAIGWGTHNAFILAADDVGIFGLITFCSIFLYGFLRVILTIPIIKDPKEKVILKILFAGLIAYLINIQFQPDFLSYYNWIYIGFIESTVIVFRKASRVQLTKS